MQLLIVCILASVHEVAGLLGVSLFWQPATLSTEFAVLKH